MAWMGLDAAAAVLGCSVRTVQREIDRGALADRYKQARREVFIPSAGVDVRALSLVTAEMREELRALRSEVAELRQALSSEGEEQKARATQAEAAAQLGVNRSTVSRDISSTNIGKTNNRETAKELRAVGWSGRQADPTRQAQRLLELADACPLTDNAIEAASGATQGLLSKLRRKVRMGVKLRPDRGSRSKLLEWLEAAAP